MAQTDYLEEALLNHLFRTSTFAKPAGIYVALVTAVGNDENAGTEVTGGSYARVQHGPADADWSAPTTPTPNAAASISNATAITFPAPTADWGTVVGVEIWDAVSGGNRLFHGSLTTPRTISNGQQAPVFQATTLILTQG